MKNYFKYLCLFVFSLISATTMTACGSDDEGGNDRKPNVTATPASVNVDGMKTATADVQISAEAEWAAYSDDEWISVSPENSTQRNATITITASKNPTTEPRTGHVYVSTATSRAEIVVNQSAGDGVPEEGAIICPIPGYKLVWHDEFDKGSSLNATDWRHEVKGHHWVNNELQNYVNETSPEGAWVTRIKDGNLQIRAFKEGNNVYSGRVYARDKQGWKYGYVEAKIKLPSGKGTWPAFWMMPVNFKSWPHDGEIDIMEEVGYHKDFVSSSLHADGHVHSNGTQVTKEVYCKGAEGEFHVYGMEWTATYFQFYVDGQKTLYYKNPELAAGYSHPRGYDWPYDAPFYVILNLAWGGDWGGYLGIDEKALPTTMEIDYVRVFQ